MTFKYDLINLLELIEARPCVWNKNSEEYKSKTLRDKSWQEIFTSLDETYEEQSQEEKKKTGMIIMTKWVNIRDAFLRSLKPKNGSQAKKKYLYAEFLQFLLTCHENNDTADITISCADDESSIELNGRESQGSYHIIDFVDTNSINDTRKVKRSKRDTDNIEKVTVDHLNHKEASYSGESNFSKQENFFTSFLPYIYDMTETEKLELHMDILKSIINIKQSRNQSHINSQTLTTTNQCTSTFHIKPDIT